MKKEHLRALRLFSQQSQKEFALAIGVSASHVSDVEVGRRRVTDRLRAKVAVAYRLTPEFFAFYDNYLRTASKLQRRK